RSHAPATPPLYTLSLHDALPILREDDRADPLEHRHVPEEAGADRRMRPHRRPLGLGQLGGLLEHRLGDADLADVVEERAELDRRSEEHTSELQSPCNLVCRLLLE